MLCIAYCQLKMLIYAEGDINISTTLLWLCGSHLLQGQGVGVHLQMVGSAVEELEEDIPDSMRDHSGLVVTLQLLT